LKSFLQGFGENILNSNEKILGFKIKFTFRKKEHVVKGSVKMFQLLLRLEIKEEYQQVWSLV
jgi:hypothetical protein